MKYCSKCGAEMVDEAVFCVKCGCLVENNIIFPQQARNTTQSSGLATAAKVFLILTIVFWSFYGLILFIALATLGFAWLGILFFIPLSWCVPMTVIYFGRTKRGEPISTGFKVCSLLFVSMIAGILMLCDNNN